MEYDKRHERPTEVDLLVGDPASEEAVGLGAEGSFGTLFRSWSMQISFSQSRAGLQERHWKCIGFKDLRRWPSRDGGLCRSAR